MRIAALLLILALMVGSAGWIGRGLYDREFMLEGRFMLVNATPQEQEIRVVFPSGVSHQSRIPSGRSHTFRVRKTGEGGVSVFLGGTEITGKNGCGYVTGSNSPQVLVVQSDKATMFHYPTSRKLDTVEAEGSSR